MVVAGHPLRKGGAPQHRLGTYFGVFFFRLAFLRAHLPYISFFIFIFFIPSFPFRLSGEALKPSTACLLQAQQFAR